MTAAVLAHSVALASSGILVCLPNRRRLAHGGPGQPRSLGLGLPRLDLRDVSGVFPMRANAWVVPLCVFGGDEPVGCDVVGLQRYRAPRVSED